MIVVEVHTQVRVASGVKAIVVQAADRVEPLDSECTNVDKQNIYEVPWLNHHRQKLAKPMILLPAAKASTPGVLTPDLVFEVRFWVLGFFTEELGF